MATYALVGGGWLGGWCWRRVARRLREEGHEVYPVTLTGLGERVHLASPQVDLETHITDVVNLIEFEDLHDVVLLGHSYANLVVTGVADRVPERISQLVYLDTGQLPNGTALIEVFPAEVRSHIERQVDEFGDGWRFPMPPQEELANFGSLEGLDEANLSKGLKRVARHSIPASAILLPVAFFLSVLSPEATEPNVLIYLAYVGALSLGVGLLVLGVGLIRGSRTSRDTKERARL